MNIFIHILQKRALTHREVKQYAQVHPTAGKRSGAGTHTQGHPAGNPMPVMILEPLPVSLSFTLL